MQENTHKYIYTFNYENIESDLCKLESKYVFGTKEQNKLLFSDQKIEPSISSFIKNRIEIISFASDYDTLLNEIKKEDIRVEGFKVEYLVFEGDKTEYANRLSKLRDIGFSIEGMHDYYNPKTTYALCNHENTWYFGILVKNNFDWHKHKQKPHSFSNSISVNIAKSLVNVAAKGNKEAKLLDACCGMGTIMLEACFAGNNIEGCDINEKIAKNARENLEYFNYNTKIYHSDIKDLDLKYDAVIIDLPYNLFTKVNDNDISHIIKASAEITDRLVIVSTTDITAIISDIGFVISGYCSVSKRGKTKFARKIWVCEKVI